MYKILTQTQSRWKLITVTDKKKKKKKSLHKKTTDKNFGAVAHSQLQARSFVKAEREMEQKRRREKNFKVVPVDGTTHQHQNETSTTYLGMAHLIGVGKERRDSKRKQI
ncbi:hypothetical protein TNCT_42261 [Trichonephila clavata]|uniref:Uncharacterized protein n=1 Tax=Trichonephila clavata TaxID=2740835 RepID=A0A8X6KUK2_TRICU|nr:hypothetical protein TNCT_42261 [Trichonephila clavata]